MASISLLTVVRIQVHSVHISVPPRKSPTFKQIGPSSVYLGSNMSWVVNRVLTVWSVCHVPLSLQTNREVKCSCTCIKVSNWTAPCPEVNRLFVCCVDLVQPLGLQGSGFPSAVTSLLWQLWHHSPGSEQDRSQRSKEERKIIWVEQMGAENKLKTVQNRADCRGLLTALLSPLGVSDGPNRPYYF